MQRLEGFGRSCCEIFYGLFTLFDVVHLDLPLHLCFVHGFRVIKFMS